MHFVVNSNRSELDLVAGYPTQWIVAYQQILFTFGSNQQSSADIHNTWIPDGSLNRLLDGVDKLVVRWIVLWPY